MMHPYAHPQHLKVLKLFVYIQYGCVMQSMGVFSLNNDTATSYRLGHTPFFLKTHPHLHTYYRMRMHQYAHPRHLKVLKHYVYIQYGCGMQSMGVCSLYNDTATSYRLGHTPFYLKTHPHLHTYYSMRMHQYAHPRHLNKMLKHIKYIQYGCGMQSMGVCSLYHDTATSYRLGHTPFYLKSPTTCTCNGTA